MDKLDSEQSNDYLQGKLEGLNTALRFIYYSKGVFEVRGEYGGDKGAVAVAEAYQLLIDELEKEYAATEKELSSRDQKK